MYLHIVRIVAQTVQIMAIIRMVCAIICTVCKMCPDSQKYSMKNARILFVVKSEFLGYNAHNLPIPDLDKEVNVQHFLHLNIVPTIFSQGLCQTW